MSTLHDRTSQRNSEFPTHQEALRAALQWVLARHESAGGAVSPAVFAVIRMIQTEIAWSQHRGDRGVRS
jgi:hypothetical protein